MRVAPSDICEDVNDEDFENLPMSFALGKESMVPMAVRGSSTTIKSKFTWTDVGMTVGADKQEKQILNSISGTLETGELCALMGPSGAGKTSLLNVLAGRTRTNRRQRITGSILLDGQPVTGAALRKRIAYVMQQDILCPTQTVRESLMFSANLRLPRSFSAKEKCAMVDQMIMELGLAKCADTYIGDDLIRGISGGEKKRTCVAIELIVQPKLVFLDEPTTGLDSFAAQNVIQKLRDLAAKEGCNVLCTIHQPSSEVFHLFNKVMLLHAGRLFFFGMVQNLSRELAGVGHACPAEYNLADHVMFLLQKESETNLELMHSKFAWKVSEEDDELVTREKSRIIAQGRTAGFCLQLWSLTKREAQGVWRNVPGLVASVVMPAVLNLLFALIFFQVGDVNAADYTAFAHFGGLFQVAIGGIFGIAQPLLLRFPMDRGIFLREYATQTYGAVPYFLSKTLVELPQSLLNAAICWTSAYWLMGLHGNFLFFVLIFWLTGTAAASTALLVGSVAANAEVAMQAAPAIFVPQLLFGGFFIRTEQIPVWLRWSQWLCSLKYGVNLYLLNEFGQETAQDWPVEARETAQVQLIDGNGVEPDLAWVYIGVLLAITIVVRLLSILFLVMRASH